VPEEFVEIAERFITGPIRGGATVRSFEQMRGPAPE
jgi:hypothetical protein